MRFTLNFCALAVALFCFGNASLQAQGQRGSAKAVSAFDGVNGVFVPEWTTPMQVSLLSNVEELVPAPMFKGAGLDRDLVNLPYKDIVVRVGQNEAVSIADISMESLTEEGSSAFQKSIKEMDVQVKGEWYPESMVVLGDLEKSGANRFQHIRIYPMQVNRNGSRVRKAAAVNYTISRRNVPAARTGGAQKTYADNSVLSNGTWAKIGITSGGVYRIDYDDLPTIGIDPAGINPRTLRIHGNGGGMLPQVAGDFRHDDLEENAIWVSGEADGSFDQGDFILFYGASPHEWYYNEGLSQWVHRYNLYSDTTYYFLSYGGANGKRISSVPSAGGVTQTPTFTDKFSYYEKDLFNPLGSGRVWLGESFDLTTSRDFNFPVRDIASGGEVKVTARVAGRSNVSSNFTIRENGSTLANILIPTTNTSIYGSYWYRSNYQIFNVPGSFVADGNLDLELVYSKPQTSSIGYLDYIEVEFPQRLSIGGLGSYSFYARENVGPGEVHQFNLTGGGNGYRVWDVTDPTAVQERSVNISGSNVSFAAEADSVKHFLTFNSNGYKNPASMARMGNQNLHALTQAEYLIITHPNFSSSATRLAEFHRSYFNRSVHVVNINEIYNEFGGGTKDPSGIRDFIKMFFDRGNDNNTQLPQYVLLMGDGSYDYKDRVVAGSNYIPSYQSRKSQRPTESYTSDDFFGFLHDDEGFWGEKSNLEGGSADILFIAEGDSIIQTEYLDVAIGRMPVNTTAEAEGIVDKVINYISNPSGFGPWRNRVLLVADHKDEDGQIHISQADSYTEDIQSQQPCINVDKLYMDNYLMESTASGSRFPDGKEALLQSLNEGSLLVNYTGHGGEVGWSNASILDISDINNLDNGNRLPAYVTATCEFGRWDDPGRQSGAEIVFLRPNAGAIAMFTTVRVVYSGPNYYLNQRFYEHVFDRDSSTNGSLPMGEIFRRTKNDSWLGGINNRNFSLMGDPAMPLAYPDLEAVVTKINGVNVVDSIIDTLSALSLVTIEGEVQDPNGNFVSDYNGDLFMTVYDKPSQFTTRRAPFNFFWQKNRVFNGQATVVNGRFSFQFVVPIDISYDDGLGKVSLYMQNNARDASGCNDNIYIGGSDAASISDDTPPELEIFMNDEKFAEGGMVGPDPVLLADIYDENGLNTVGTGIGHELTAILNGDENNVIVLNDFYQASKNSYQEGRIEYPFTELPEGEHELEVKVWDVANNSSTARVTFVVADDAQMALGHVLNYPNPFTTNTKFYLEHNRNGAPLNVTIKIFTVSGRVVKTLEDSFFADGNLYCDLEWDGLDEFGDALGRGVYVYQVQVKDESTGEKISRFEKLVVLR